LIIPRKLTNTTSSQQLLPDSEVVFSPSAVSFDVQGYVAQAGGYLSSFREWHKSTGMQSGLRSSCAWPPKTRSTAPVARFA